MIREELLSQVYSIISDSGFTVEEIQEVLYAIQLGELNDTV